MVSDDCSDPARYAEMQRGARRRPALRPSRARERRRGFYHNFERALELAPARRPLRRAGRPGRRLGPRQARDAACTRSATRSSPTATSGSSRRRGSVIADTLLGARAPTTTRTCCRCWWPTASPAPRRCSGAELLDDALPLPPAQFTHLPRPLAGGHGARARRHPLRRPPALRLRPARRTPTLGHATRHPDDAAARPLFSARRRPARADPAVAHALLHRRLPAAAVRDRRCGCAAPTG